MAAYRSMLELKIPSREAASLTGVSRTTANRKPAPPRDHVPAVPQNKLGAAELTEFVDLAPMQVYIKLLDQGIYPGSLSTFYQAFTWDITKLAGPVKVKYFDCYLMVDIHSRFIAAAHVHATEAGALAVEMMKETFGIHGIPQVVHADRGTSRTSKTVAALLSDLDLTRSHFRPRVSNDHGYSEALYKTLK